MIILHPDQRQALVERVVEASYARGGRTRFVGTRAEDFNRLGLWVRDHLDPSCAAVIADARTLEIEGHRVRQLLDEAGLLVHIHQVDDSEGKSPICSSIRGESIARALALHGADLIISVGSGTLTDLGKLAARSLNVPHVAVATAASMNGFTSGLAAVLDDGVKLTSPAPAPVAVFAHPETLRNAPKEMSASGLGDLHSKPVSSADWRLGHLLNGAPWDVPVVELLETVSELMDGVAEGLRDGITDAFGQLFAGLCLTGVAMQAASKGSQASGAEHLISHYLDMIAGSPSFNHTASTHGAQVAVGCMVSIEAWTFALNRIASKHPLGEIPAYLTDLDAQNRLIDSHFRDLAPSVRAMFEKSPTSDNTRHGRRDQLQREGLALLRDAASSLRPRESLEHELEIAGCATRFVDLEIDETLAAQTIRFAPWVRARYTILHLIDELGWYEEFVEHAAKKFAAR